MSQPVACQPPSMVITTEQSLWFKEEVHPHEPALRAWLQGQFPTLLDVDDIVQESYLRLLRARQQGPISSAKAYLFVVARNAALGVFRKRKLISYEAVDDFEGSRISSHCSDVVETVSTRQEFALAIQAIAGLPARCREIVLLRAMRGLSHKEIAGQLGLSEQTVRVQVARGMKKCAEFLRERGIHGKSDHDAL